MQVKTIQLVERVQIDEAFDVVGWKEVPSDVEHRATPLEARSVDDVRRRHDETTLIGGVQLDGGGKELAKRLHAVEQSCRLSGDDLYAFFRRRELVPLGVERRARWIECEHDARVGSGHAGGE